MSFDTTLKNYFALEDCNGNGVPDQTDRDIGILEDLNKNGIDDQCEPDSDRVVQSELRKLRHARNRNHIEFTYQSAQRQIVLHCSLSPGLHAVRVVATSPDKSRTRTIASDLRVDGEQDIVWAPVDEARQPEAKGRWIISLAADGEIVARPVMWDWTTVMK